MTQIKFSPGQVVATLGATHVASMDQIKAILDRHCSGDWGDLGDEDKQANERALKHGDRLVSKYEIAPDTFLYAITEYDRSVTTVLCPDEY